MMNMVKSGKKKTKQKKKYKQKLGERRNGNEINANGNSESI